MIVIKDKLDKNQILYHLIKSAVNDDCTIQICDFGLARSMEGVHLKEVEIEEEKQLDLTELIQPVPLKIGKKSVSEFSASKKSSNSSKKNKSNSSIRLNEEFNPENKESSTPFNMRKQAIETKRPALTMIANPGQSMATISESRDEQNSTITSWY